MLPKVRRERNKLHHRPFAVPRNEVLERVTPGSATDQNEPDLLQKNARSMLFGPFQQSKKAKLKERHEKWIEIDLSSFNEILSNVPDNTNADAKSKDVEASKSPNPKGNKAGKRAAVAEMQRFREVLRHPAFKADALSTIQTHMKNTLQMKQNTVETHGKTMDVD
ncbi:880_t:CDS:2 [Paraglomus occultum]|uniref:Ribosome biogenesis protein SLX9 n=1 Tax=Paraglomus occultum TaxID=144539 RepID=A0A9N8ZIK0_9GLOM|nr:880_t:CDS:2 [Paraglomus occultum]